MNEKNGQDAELQRELQEKVIELNMLDSRFKEIQQQINLIDNQLNEIKILENNLNELGKISKTNDSLSQVGPGVFVKSEIKETKEVFVDIGAKIIIKKTKEEAKELIDKRARQIMDIRSEVMKELNNTILKAQFLESEIREKAKLRQ